MKCNSKKYLFCRYLFHVLLMLLMFHVRGERETACASTRVCACVCVLFFLFLCVSIFCLIVVPKDGNTKRSLYKVNKEEANYLKQNNINIYKLK